jgi:hypothetical protein
MELNSISLNDFVKLAEIIFKKGEMSVPQVMRNSGFYNVSSIPQNSGNTRDFSEIDLEEYADNKGESAQSERAKIQQGYTKSMTAKRVAKDIGISYEMRTQNKYQEVVRRLTNLGALVSNRMDLDLAHRISFMTATTYTDKNGETVAIDLGDDLALASTAHTVRGSSTTYRNLLANNPRLGKGALQAMRRLIVSDTINQFGEKVSMNFDVIWTTDEPEDIDMAQEILKSTSNRDQANANVINVDQARYRHIIFPRVATTATGAVDSTKKNYWGIYSTANSQAHLGIWEEARMKTPAAGNNGEDFASDDWDFGARGGYGITILSGAFTKFSKGDGTA